MQTTKPNLLNIGCGSHSGHAAGSPMILLLSPSFQPPRPRLMKNGILNRLVLTCLLTAMLGSPRGCLAQSTCCITFPSGDNAATLVVSLPWAISYVAGKPDYSSADN